MFRMFLAWFSKLSGPTFIAYIYSKNKPSAGKRQD